MDDDAPDTDRVDVQERRSSAPKSPVERRARRREVENSYIVGVRTTVLMETLSKKYGVHPSVIARDMRLVRRRWDANEKRRGSVRAHRQLEALEQIATALRARGDLEREAEVRWKICRLIGMGGATVNVDARRQTVVVNHAPRLPDDDSLRDALRILSEQRILGPGQEGGGAPLVLAAAPVREAARVLAAEAP